MFSYTSGIPKKLIRDAVTAGIDYILSQQQNDGSFVSLSSEDPLFNKTKTVHTTFFTSIILSMLGNITSKDVLNCNKKAVAFLLSQKNEHWSWNYWVRSSKEEKQFPYPDDLDDTFCALTALYQYNKKHIDGSVLAKIVMLLMVTETQEGGPYFTWLVDKGAPTVWKDTDIAVNSNVAYFLSLNKINLPNIQTFIDQRIENRNFNSPYYASIYPVIYFISRFYCGTKKEELREVLMSRRDAKGAWENPLSTAMAVSSLLNLGTPFEELDMSIVYLLQNNSDGHWKAFPFVSERIKKTGVQFGGSSTLTTSFCIEALTKYTYAQKSTQRKSVKMVNAEKDKENITTLIMHQVEKRFEAFDQSIQDETSKLLDAIIYKDPTKQIPLLPYYFASCLSEKNQNKIDKSLLTKLGVANVFGWMAYTIFDDFLDEEADDPKILSVATVSLRELTLLFSSALPNQTGFHTHFNTIMDEIDIANTWELAHCRFKSNKIPVTSIIIPNFGDYKIIAAKSLGHCLSPLALLYSLGYKKDSSEVKQLISFFNHFLIAKQLNDDAHDWDKDLKKGQINPVSAQVLNHWKRNNNPLSKKPLIAVLPQLQEYFWTDTIEEVCKIISDHIGQAKIALKEISIIENPSLFENFLIPIEHATNKALTERENMLKFIKTYQTQ